jgi:hypothetical protein
MLSAQQAFSKAFSNSWRRLASFGALAVASVAAASSLRATSSREWVGELIGKVFQNCF